MKMKASEARKANWLKCEVCGKVDKSIRGHVGTKDSMRCPDCCGADGKATLCRNCCPTKHETEFPVW